MFTSLVINDVSITSILTTNYMVNHFKSEQILVSKLNSENIFLSPQ